VVSLTYRLLPQNKKENKTNCLGKLTQKTIDNFSKRVARKIPVIVCYSYVYFISAKSTKLQQYNSLVLTA